MKCLIFQKAGVKVFVLLYKELEIALTINSHYSKHALMNKCPENIKVWKTSLYTLFLIFALKQRLWVLVRTASLRRF